MRMWSFSEGFSDERDRVTGERRPVVIGRPPMNGVELDLGVGDDVVILMGGPRSGRIDGDPGNDRIWTRGGYSLTAEPARGGYTISCGPGFDYVQPGPDDRVGPDCERLVLGSSGEEAPDGFDIASTCGVARFDFRGPSGDRGALRRDRPAASTSFPIVSRASR